MHDTKRSRLPAAAQRATRRKPKRELGRPPSLPRWAEMYPTVEFMLPDLLILHENIHIGQLRIWQCARRDCPE